MALDLTIIQKPLDVCPTHSDHTWNIALNDYSAYTNVRLVVDVYSNPYSNDWGTNTSTKQARLFIPVNEYGNCIFNLETIIRNFVEANPRNMSYRFRPTSSAGLINPYEVEIPATSGCPQFFTATTSQAVIVNDSQYNIKFSNGFNGGYQGFQNIYQINEYRPIFGVSYTTGTSKTQIIIIDTANYNVYSGWTGQTLNPASAATQPYGITIYPGVQDNKRYGVSNLSAFTYYYSGTNLTGQYNYLNTQIFDYAMNTGVAPFNQYGLFMATYGTEKIPMTAFGGPIQQTRWRTHYYECPILVPFMFGENQLYDNSNVVGSITFLTKNNSQNGQYNYDYSETFEIQPITGSTYLSPLGSRIAYGIYKHQQCLTNEYSDVAIFLSSGTCDPSGAERVSEIVQYKMVGKECLNDPYFFLFMNRQGVWDTYTFTKKSQKTYQPQQKRYASYKSLNTPLWNRQSYDSAETTYYGTAVELFTFDSGFVYQNDADVIEQLLMSPQLYMIMDNYYQTGDASQIYPYLIPCVIMNKDVKVFQQKYERIFQYTLEVKQTPYRLYDLPY